MERTAAHWSTKTPWRDDTTPLVMSPPELMQRLAAVVLLMRCLHLG